MSRQKNEDRDIFVNISYIYRIHKMISNEIERVAVGAILLLKFSRQNDTIITIHAQVEHNTSNHNSLSIIFVCQTMYQIGFSRIKSIISCIFFHFTLIF